MTHSWRPAEGMSHSLHRRRPVARWATRRNPARPEVMNGSFTAPEVRGPAKSRVQPPGFRRCRATDPSPLARARDPDVANDSFATPEAPNDSFAAPDPAKPGPVPPPPRQRL